jgi:hypothetical protein
MINFVLLPQPAVNGSGWTYPCAVVAGSAGIGGLNNAGCSACQTQNTTSSVIDFAQYPICRAPPYFPNLILSRFSPGSVSSPNFSIDLAHLQ